MKKLIFSLFAFAFFSTVLGGCATVNKPVAINLTKSGPRVSAPAALPNYLERRSYSRQSGEKIVFLIAKIEPGLWNWSLAEDRGEPKTPSAWRRELGATIAVNGVYFTASGTPAGYLRLGAAGKSLKPWPRESERKNKIGYTGAGIISGGRLDLAYLPTDEVDPEKGETIFLTYPTLTVDGEAAVEKETGLVARRTALAEDDAGNVYVIVTEAGGLTLREFSAWLAAQPEKFYRAINLDGGPSTGFSLQDGEATIDFGFAEVPNALIIRKK